MSKAIRMTVSSRGIWASFCYDSGLPGDTMSIYKRGKIYWYKFSFLGKTYQASTRLKNEREAAKVEAKLKTDLALGIYGLQPMKPGPTFKDYAESFREYVKNHSDVPATIQMYGKSLKRLLEYRPLAD